LAACAAAAAAAAAHFAIDVVGDYALAHDTYDDVAHSSRGLVSGVAVLLAVLLACRGLRICGEMAAAFRYRLPQRPFSVRERLAFILTTIAASAILVPAMECLDGQLGGLPVEGLGAAFGGSVWLGLGTTIVCAAFVAALVYAVAGWLVSHRDDIATIIGALLRRNSGAVRPLAQDLARHSYAPRRKRALYALSLSKRGPPAGVVPVH
jgi:hypothetical protein